MKATRVVRGDELLESDRLMGAIVMRTDNVGDTVNVVVTLEGGAEAVFEVDVDGQYEVARADTPT